jgi:hypothetical protein
MLNVCVLCIDMDRASRYLLAYSRAIIILLLMDGTNPVIVLTNSTDTKCMAGLIVFMVSYM